jgi:hypothetical protein
MAGKTYEVGLISVLRLTYGYITRWQLKLKASMTDAQFACLTASLTAITSCLQALGERPKE